MIITVFYAGLLALWFLFLSALVVSRRRGGIAMGDGGDPRMLRAIRGHANFAEYVPFILLMMLMLEMARTSIYVLHVLGILLVVSRVLHGLTFGFTQRFVFGRTVGAALTFVVLLVCGVLCVMQGIRGMTLTM
jgi:uncharacterized membrane protein YecN with MAPEG domain